MLVVHATSECGRPNVVTGDRLTMRTEYNRRPAQKSLHFRVSRVCTQGGQCQEKRDLYIDRQRAGICGVVGSIQLFIAINSHCDFILPDLLAIQPRDAFSALCIPSGAAAAAVGLLGDGSSGSNDGID